MPNYRIPRGNSLHRTAAIALYRALLTQCRAVPLTIQRVELQNVVRNRFKQAKHVHSWRRLKVAFEAGYEAIDHLDAAVAGNEESKSYLVSLLERAPSKVKEAPRLKHVTAEPEQAGNHIGDLNGANLATRSIFDRPLPLEQLSGKRHVPVLFNANRIPVLRIKKPQPASLSHYIRHRILTREAWHDRRYRLADEYQLAALEDNWDELTKSHLVDTRNLADGMEGPHLQEPRWTEAVAGAQREVRDLLQAERIKNRAMAEKMQAVVDREKALFYKERAERRAAKRHGRLERKRVADHHHETEHEANRAEVDGLPKPLIATAS